MFYIFHLVPKYFKVTAVIPHDDSNGLLQIFCTQGTVQSDLTHASSYQHCERDFLMTNVQIRKLKLRERFGNLAQIHSQLISNRIPLPTQYLLFTLF